ncbi:MAG: hypothetical protein H8E25_01125 [Planctomycetes bacterium]|nr:hypothetical protein [Planctomycetota bacterium]
MYSFPDRTPFLTPFPPVVGPGSTVAGRTGSLYRVTPSGAAGRTVFIEGQWLSAGVVYDSNTIRLDVL